MAQARAAAASRGLRAARVEHADAFALSPAFLDGLDRDLPLLGIGNPPWVTSAGQGSLAVQNLPAKSNAAFGLTGLDALTGKANFDIAEAILLRLLELTGDFRDVRLAFLVKRSVAMKLCRRLLGTAAELSFAAIDAAAHFGAAVDAGLFCARRIAGGGPVASDVRVAESLGGASVRRAGFRNGGFVEDLDAHGELAHLEAATPVPWRQGVKHDAAKVLELSRTDRGLVNGLGEPVRVEEEPLCPLYKSSDVANGRAPQRLFPLFQVDLSGPFGDLESRWPLLAAYLARHEDLFAARRSRIYEGKPRFSIFGVGPYTTAPWKVAVSGMYRSARFEVIGPAPGGQPSLVDDTCYLLPFERESDARGVAAHLNAPEPQRFLRSLMDSGAKRPVTKALLSRIEIPLTPSEASGAADRREALPAG